MRLRNPSRYRLETEGGPPQPLRRLSLNFGRDSQFDLGFDHHLDYQLDPHRRPRLYSVRRFDRIFDNALDRCLDHRMVVPKFLGPRPTRHSDPGAGPGGSSQDRSPVFDRRSLGDHLFDHRS